MREHFLIFFSSYMLDTLQINENARSTIEILDQALNFKDKILDFFDVLLINSIDY